MKKIFKLFLVLLLLITSLTPILNTPFSTRQAYAETCVYYNYDPELGRFISRDPIKGNLITPQSQHPYQYAYNNPVNLSDPSGEGPRFGNPYIDGLIMTAEAVYRFLVSDGDPTNEVRTINLLQKVQKIKIPNQAMQVLNKYTKTGGQLKGYMSKPYKNLDNKLPRGGNYIEHDINPFASNASRGTERIVIDTKTGNAWYTPDHYKTFVKIK